MNLKLITAIISILIATRVFAQKRLPESFNQQLTKPTGEPMATLVNINNFSMWIQADGISGHNPFTDETSVVYPRGTVGVIWQDGIVWGGFVRDGQVPELRVGGQYYKTGVQPGALISKGAAEDPNDTDVRIWRIRRNYQTADLTRDVAELNNIPVEEVTEAQIQAVRQQYEKDWNEWPWPKGAPFYDSNGNGVMEPGEEPGLANADQVVWFVANDLDSTVIKNFSGSHPIGLEMQVTLWAYDRLDVLGNVIFKRYRLIYKGTLTTLDTAHIDSMYIAQFSNPDLGTFSDDFVGCDSVLSLGYVYNSSISDDKFHEFSLIPPGVGYDFLQGPLVPGSQNDVAIFDLKKKPGFRNLPMTSFVYEGAGDAFGFPPLGVSAATFQWYNLLRGYFPTTDIENPLPFIDPITNQPNRFTFSGDPVTGTGWIDGIVLPPGERQLLANSGPFNIALGDTQEMVIALIGAIGEDHLLSVAELKKADSQIQTLYNSFFMTSFPTTTIKSDYSNKQQTKFTIQAWASTATEVRAQFTAPSGNIIDTLPLFDDGAHQDSLAGDGLFGNVWTTAPRADGVSLGLITISLENDTLSWPRLLQQIPTFGPVEAISLLIRSDNINSDGQINPGENIHLSAQVGNAGIRNIQSLKILITTNDPWVEVQDRGQSLNFLSAQDTVTVVYDFQNPETFSAFQIATDFPPGHLIEFDITLYDNHFNLWKDKKSLAVKPFQVEPKTQLVKHIQGPAAGTFGLYILDPSALTAHTYRITINDTSGRLENRTLNLIDITASDTLLQSHPLPNEFSHNMPIIDGFKITRGSLAFDFALDQFFEVAFAGQSVDLPINVWHQPNSNGSYALSAGGGDGSLNRLTRNGRILQKLKDHELEVRFTNTGGYGWWSFIFNDLKTAPVPFELWDIGIATPDDSSDDARLIPLLFPDGGTNGIFEIEPNTLDGFFGKPSTDNLSKEVIMDSKILKIMVFLWINSKLTSRNWWICESTAVKRTRAWF